MNILLTNALLWRAEPAPVFEEGELLLSDGRIAARGKPGKLLRDTDAHLVDLGGALVAPGLIDLHTHGRVGGDFTSADVPTLQRMSRSYLRAGTTTVMPTFASEPIESYVAAAGRVVETATTPQGARWVGFHLEGRYLNPEKRGAHATPLLAPLDANELSALHEQMCRPYGSDKPPVRVSAALELDKDGSFAATARALGASLSLAHTCADYDQAMHAIDNGTRSFTHLFNAMPPLHHRAGGAVVACLEAAATGKDVYGELICDGLHIAPEMIRLAYRSLGKDHTLLITDSMMGTDCPDGEYTVAGEHVLLKNGRALTESGALAGSTISLYEGVCNLSDMCGISLAEALIGATRNPARLLGLSHELGTLAVGARADLLVIDPATRALRSVWLDGEEVTP